MNMQYRIKIEKEIPPSEPKQYISYDTVYEQIVENLPIEKVIAVVNGLSANKEGE